MRERPASTTAYTFFVIGAILIVGVLFFGLITATELSWLYAYLVAINAAAFFLMGHDKNAARHRGLRVPEKVIILAALIGGSVGTIAGINLFRHKTRKASFQFFLALVLIIQIICLRYFVA